MKENIKIGLLAVITATLMYQTFLKKEKNHDSHSATEHVEGDHQNVNSLSLNNTDPTLLAPPVPEPNLPKTSLKFGTMAHDFGKVKQNTENKYIFKFTNTGTQPLVISSAVGSCGCTVPEYPKEPIAPGKEGEIKVVYSPGTQEGKQQKKVTITANTEPKQTEINISADVFK